MPARAELPAPGGLFVTVLSCYQINIGWTAVSGASSYTLWRNGTLRARVGGTIYPDKTFTPGALTSYAVAAVDAAGVSSVQSAAVSITAPTCPTPTATPTRATSPTAVPTATATATSTPTATPCSAGGVDQAATVEALRSLFAWKLDAQHSIDQAVAVGLTPEEVQYYLGRESALSAAILDVQSLLPQELRWPVAPLPTPAAPSNVSVECTAARSVTVGWKSGGWTSGYTVERKDGAGAFAPIGNWPIPPGAANDEFDYYDLGAEPSHDYTYRLRSYGMDATGAVYSPYSAEIQVSTPADVPALGAPQCVKVKRK